MITVTPKQAKELLVKAIKAKVVPSITSSPGLAKSSIVKEIAEEFNLKLIDIRLAQCEPTDLLGLVSYTKDKERFKYAPSTLFPLENDSIPKGYSGFLIFLDEMNGASKAVQLASYRLILDRQIGEHNLHPNTAIICAGNLITDKAIVSRMSTAMQSRLVHLQMEASVPEWIDWALVNDIDHRIISYIGFSPKSLHNFNPDHNDHTFPCPRTWEMLSNIIKNESTISVDLLPLIVGTISEVEARQFKVYIEICNELPTIEEILSSPKTAKLTKEPAILYAVSGLVSHNLSTNTGDSLLKYIDRMPLEFQIITLQQAIKKDPKIISLKSIKDWININKSEIL